MSGAGGIRRAAALAALAVTVACGAPPRDAEDAVEREGDSVASLGTSADSMAALERPREDSVAPPRAEVATPADSGGPPLRSYSLRLVNPRGVEARVFASAGAARVALDTLAAGDSARVDVRVRATTLWLEAEDPAGRPLGRVELELREGRLHRWEVPGGAGRASEPEAAASGAPGRLVPARTPDYARSTRRAGRGTAMRRGATGPNRNASTEGLDGA